MSQENGHLQGGQLYYIISLPITYDSCTEKFSDPQLEYKSVVLKGTDSFHKIYV